MPEWLTTLVGTALVPLFTAVLGVAGGAIFMRRKYNVDVFAGVIASVKEAQAFLRSELTTYREEIVMLRELLKKAEEVGRTAIEQAEDLKRQTQEAVEDAMHWRREESNRRVELDGCKRRVESMQAAFDRGVR